MKLLRVMVLHIFFEAVVNPFVSSADENQGFIFGIRVSVFLSEGFC